MSGGRFRLGLGSQIRPHIENRYGATWSPPAARMREIVLAVKAILGAWQDGTRLDFRGEHTRHTLMPPTFVPGPTRSGAAAGAARRARAGDDPDRGRGRRRAAGDAVPQPPARPRAHPARGRRRGWPGAADPADVRGLSAGDRGDGPDRRSSWRPPRSACAGCWRSTAPRRRTARSSTSRAGATSSPSSTRCPRPATIAAMVELVDRRDGRHPRGPRHPRGVRGRARSAASATSPTGSAATSRGTTPASTSIRALAAALV